MNALERVTIEFTLNGREVVIKTTPYRRLVDLLREDLGLTGTKEGCGVGECGACTVILDGEAVASCLVLAAQVHGRHVVTIEGVEEEDGALDPIQEAVLDHMALQCGFCTPGFIMSAKALIDKNPNVTLEEVRRAISGNLCRCTGYEQLAQAIFQAAQMRLAAINKMQTTKGGE